CDVMDELGLISTFIFGIVLGSLAGLIPGIHPNTISQIISNLNVQDNFELAAIIIITAAVNNMVALLPAIFLFIPDSDSVLSILPAQKLVLNGKGRLAVLVCAISAFLTLLFLILILPLSYISLPLLFPVIKPYLAYILILFSVFFLLQEKKIKESLFVFLISGLFGYLILSTSISALLQESLFAVFVGFFALSSIILSFNEKSLIPEQRNESYKIEIGKSFIIVILLSSLIGAIADLFPAINSPAQLATFVSPFASNPLLFLSSTTSITISHYANSIVALERIGKARTGTLVNINQLISDFNATLLIWFIAFYFVGTIIGILLFLGLSEIFISAINKIDQRLISFSVLIFLILSVFLFSGVFGLLTCILATFIGLLPPLLGVRRTNLMAFLIIPSIMIFL
ncbi:MAG: tripartite tricarboxylate transporter permease, partial [Candidatus Micrarchaeia archaeon]